MKQLLTIISVLFLASATCQEPDLHGYSQAKYDSLLAVNETLRGLEVKNDSLLAINQTLRDSIQIMLPRVLRDSIEIDVDDIYFEMFDYETRFIFSKQGKYFTIKTISNQ
jgi:hypothetical protein